MMYKIYVGLNDKTTKRQEVKTAAARRMVEKIICENCEGATMYDARGVFRHRNGAIVHEKTFVIELLAMEEYRVENICSALRVALNQECVLYQRVESWTQFICE